MASVSAGHIILTPTQPVGSGRPQRESNPGPPLQESRALPQSYRAPQTGRRDLDFCLSRTHYTDTDPISKERAATEIERARERERVRGAMKRKKRGDEVCLFGFLTTRLYRGRADEDRCKRGRIEEG